MKARGELGVFVVGRVGLRKVECVFWKQSSWMRDERSEVSRYPQSLLCECHCHVRLDHDAGHQ